MEEFFNDKLVEIEEETTRALALTSEAIAVRENVAKMSMSVACLRIPATGDRLRSAGKIAQQSQNEFNAFVSSELLALVPSRECSDTDEQGRMPEDHAGIPADESAHSDAEEVPIIELQHF